MDRFKKIFLFLLELEEQTHVHLKIKKFQKWWTWKIPWFTPTLKAGVEISQKIQEPFGPLVLKGESHIFLKAKFGFPNIFCT